MYLFQGTGKGRRHGMRNMCRADGIAPGMVMFGPMDTGPAETWIADMMKGVGIHITEVMNDTTGIMDITKITMAKMEADTETGINNVV